MPAFSLAVTGVAAARPSAPARPHASPTAVVPAGAAASHLHAAGASNILPGPSALATSAALTVEALAPSASAPAAAPALGSPGRAQDRERVHNMLSSWERFM